jgi:hypothetical protein
VSSLQHGLRPPLILGGAARRIEVQYVSADGRKVIERFANDPQLGTEAKRILQGRGRND